MNPRAPASARNWAEWWPLRQPWFRNGRYPPTGRFAMGRDTGTRAKPRHDVTVNRFALGLTEVTFAGWDLCVSKRGCAHRPNDAG